MNSDRKKRNTIIGIAAAAGIFLCCSGCERIGFDDIYGTPPPEDPAISYWSKAYGGQSRENITDIAVDSDGSYIVVGNSMSWSSSAYYKMVMYRTASSGEILWAMTFEEKDDEFSVKSGVVRCAASGGYIAASRIGSINKADVLLTRVSKDGAVLWQKSYGDSRSSDIPAAVLSTADGGFVVAATFDQFAAISNNADIWLFKVDRDGNVEWSKRYNAGTEETCADACLNSSGGYTVAGNSIANISQPNESQICVFRVNTDGDLVAGESSFADIYGAGGRDTASEIRETPDKTFVIGGASASGGEGGSDILVFEIMPDNGEIHTQNVYGTSLEESCAGMEITEEGGIIVVGNTAPEGEEQPHDGVVLFLNSIGIIVREAGYGGEEAISDDELCGIRVLHDKKSHVIAGRTYAFGLGYDDMWLFVIDGEGKSAQPKKDTKLERKGSSIAHSRVSAGDADLAVTPVDRKEDIVITRRKCIMTDYPKE
ncbi:MAG: hypothetical protein JW881_19345 [Spirochaetales bacterium]|nr:hypothetical protein [Spirochaetales bacterium]